MTQPGAFLALWNGVDTTQVSTTEYETWHSFEHVPERAGLPGFIEARRYRRLEGLSEGGPQYYTCYWLQSREALATSAYREVVAHPTPWSARMRGALNDFLRLPCDLVGAYGSSAGVYLSTLRLRAVDDAVMVASLASLLFARVNDASALCAQWGWAHPSNDFPLGATKSASTDGDSLEAVLMVQHLDLPALQASTEDLQHALGLRAVSSQLVGYYGLLSQVRQANLSAPLHSRQPQRTELMQRFLSGDRANE